MDSFLPNFKITKKSISKSTAKGMSPPQSKKEFTTKRKEKIFISKTYSLYDHKI